MIELQMQHLFSAQMQLFVKKGRKCSGMVNILLIIVLLLVTTFDFEYILLSMQYSFTLVEHFGCRVSHVHRYLEVAQRKL